MAQYLCIASPYGLMSKLFLYLYDFLTLFDYTISITAEHLYIRAAQVLFILTIYYYHILYDLYINFIAYCMHGLIDLHSFK